MRYIIVIFIVVLMSPSLYAQLAPISQVLHNRTCLDTAHLKVRYSFRFKNHPLQKTYNEDIRIVQAGKNVIKDFSEIVFYYDSLATECDKKGLQSSTNPNITYPCEVYNYYRMKRTNEKYRMILNAGVLCYDSKWFDLKWIYSEDEPINISGYRCNKATVSFAGRDYTAWYTLDVPAPFGPYKFWGLPGLIVKLEEVNGMYIWEMIGLSRDTSHIYNYHYELEQKCNAETAAKTIKRMMTTPLTFLKSVGTKFYVKKSDGSFSNEVKAETPLPYEPIELK